MYVHNGRSIEPKTGGLNVSVEVFPEGTFSRKDSLVGVFVGVGRRDRPAGLSWRRLCLSLPLLWMWCFSLPNSATVEQVVHSEAGLERGFSPGNVRPDTSSSKPSSTRRIAAYLVVKEVSMLDAPVSGGALKARKGRLR